jgi:four helix bundle protein
MAYRFEELVVWQKAMQFVKQCYDASRRFPKAEHFGITSQLRRAATSMPLNIAEGCGARTRKEFAQFLYIALRSEYEVATIIRLAMELGYLDVEGGHELDASLAEVGRLLQALINSVERRVAD